MEQPEDISQLVVGMTGSSVFNELFSGAQGMTGERLTAWFDTATATLGGRDVIEAVREMLGNVSRFDFQTVGSGSAAGRHSRPRTVLHSRRRPAQAPRSKRVRTVWKSESPDAWKSRSYAVRDRYDGLVFDRSLRGEGAASTGVGRRPHPLRHRPRRSPQSPRAGRRRWRESAPRSWSCQSRTKSREPGRSCIASSSASRKPGGARSCCGTGNSFLSSTA